MLRLLRDDGVVQLVTVATLVGPACLIQRAALAAFWMLREDLSRREVFEAGVLRRTSLSRRAGCASALFSAVNLLKRARALRERVRVVKHRSLLCSPRYVLCAALIMVGRAADRAGEQDRRADHDEQPEDEVRDGRSPPSRRATEARSAMSGGHASSGRSSVRRFTVRSSRIGLRFSSRWSAARRRWPMIAAFRGRR